VPRYGRQHTRKKLRKAISMVYSVFIKKESND
jgi:hypothetical protein